MNRLTLSLCAAVIVGASVSTASAQLVFGSRTSFAGAGAAYYLNLDSLTLTRLWTQVNNHRPNAFAADTTNGIIYSVDSARLSYWNYGSLGVASTFVSSNGGTYRNNGTVNTATGVDGLEFVNGTLYGWTNYNIGSITYSDGIYSIATSGLYAGLMQPVWLNDDVYDFEGLAYNPANGLFYGTNTSSASPKGLYTIDALNNPNAIPQFVTGFDPALGLTSFDGLAIGNGSAWLTQYVNGTLADNSDDLLVISKYNLTTGVYDDSIGVVIPSNSQIGSGACWAPNAILPIPEPGALCLAGAIPLAAKRRRR